MSKISLIEDSVSLDRCIAEIEKQTWVGVDTEFLREKTYYPKLCLVQLHSGGQSYCVDALALEDLQPLENVLVSEKHTKVLHSCRQDLEAFDRKLSQPLANVFDSQIAAAFCGFGDQVSYAEIVKEIAGVSLSKAQTRTDWSDRPLSDDQLQYAVDDVRYLPQVSDHLNSELELSGRMEWVREECLRIVEDRSFLIDPNHAWKRLRGAGKLQVRLQYVARELANWREMIAQKRDRPREWILSTRAIIAISKGCPTSLSSLGNIDGVSNGIVRGIGKEILKIVDSALEYASDVPIWTKPVPLDREQKNRVKEIMGFVRSISEESGISQSLLGNRNEIEAIVKGRQDTLIQQGWRGELIGKSIFQNFINPAFS